MPLYNPPQTPLSVTTNGDIQTFSTTPARLPVGSDGQILESRASETTGLKWVTPNTIPTDGWTPASETWTYASATTITVPTGAASKYSKGDKIKLTQNTVKYFYIVGVADTVLTITGGSSYTLTGAAISNNYYSHQGNPVGFPKWFNWIPTWNNFTVGDATLNKAIFSINGSKLDIEVNITLGSSSSVSGVITLASLPVAITNNPDNGFVGLARLFDAGITQFIGFLTPGSSTTLKIAVIKCDVTYSQNIDTSSTIPFVWTTSDIIGLVASCNI